MSDTELINKVLEFEKYLRKLNIKQKSTVLMTQLVNCRTDMRRTDLIKDALNPKDYIKIEEIFKSTLKIDIKNFDDFTALLTVLAKKQLVLRLDRIPMSVKSELKRWPEKMQLANVS